MLIEDDFYSFDKVRLLLGFEVVQAVKSRRELQGIDVARESTRTKKLIIFQIPSKV